MDSAETASSQGPPKIKVVQRILSLGDAWLFCRVLLRLLYLLLWLLLGQWLVWLLLVKHTMLLLLLRILLLLLRLLWQWQLLLPGHSCAGWMCGVLRSGSSHMLLVPTSRSIMLLWVVYEIRDAWDVLMVLGPW